MANILLSMFETYLLDEELDLEKQQAQVDLICEEPADYEYPPGFFSGL